MTVANSRSSRVSLLRTCLTGGPAMRLFYLFVIGMVGLVPMALGDHYLDAQTAMEEGDYKTARASFEAYLLENADGANAEQALYDLAHACDKLGDFAGAAHYQHRLLTGFPETALEADALVHAAFLNVRLGRQEAAQTLIDRFLTDFPDHAMAPQMIFQAGENHYVAGNYVDAANAYIEFLDRFPNDPNCVYANFKIVKALEKEEKRLRILYESDPTAVDLAEADQIGLQIEMQRHQFIASVKNFLLTPEEKADINKRNSPKVLLQAILRQQGLTLEQAELGQMKDLAYYLGAYEQLEHKGLEWIANNPGLTHEHGDVRAWVAVSKLRKVNRDLAGAKKLLNEILTMGFEDNDVNEHIKTNAIFTLAIVANHEKDSDRRDEYTKRLRDEMPKGPIKTKSIRQVDQLK